MAASLRDVSEAARELQAAVDGHVAACAAAADGRETDTDASYDRLASAAQDFDQLVGEVLGEVTPFAAVRVVPEPDDSLRPGERELHIRGERVSVRTRIDFAVDSTERLLAIARQRFREMSADDGTVDEEAGVPDALAAVATLLEHEARAPLAEYGDEHGLRAAGWASDVIPVDVTLQELPEDDWPADPFALPEQPAD